MGYKKIIYYLLSLVVLLAAVLSASSWIDSNVGKVSVANYDSKTDKSPIATRIPAEFNFPPLVFKFSFQAYNDVPIAAADVTYENLFQSAVGNDGIRLELAYQRGGTSRWALVIGRSGRELLSYDLGVFPAFATWHTFDMSLGADAISVIVDGETRLKQEYAPTDFKMDDFAIGTGFSKERPFFGAIAKFSIASVSHRELKKYERDAVAGLFILIALVASAFFYFSSVRHFMLLFSVAPVVVGIEITTLYVAGFDWLNLALHLAVATICVYLLATLLDAVKARAIRLSLALILALAYFFLVLTLTSAGLYLFHVHGVQANSLSSEELGAIFQTSGGEVSEFFASFFTEKEQLLIFAVAFVAALPIVVYATRGHCWRPAIPPLVYLLVSLSLSLAWPVENSLFDKLTSALASYHQQVADYRQQLAVRRSLKSLTAKKQKQGETYVLVIGESGNRDHLSAYGYFRDTTPWLNAQLQSTSWLKFENAYSAYCHTIPSLLYTLTSADQYNHKDPISSESLISVLKAAGFDTYWIDEQGTSLGDTPLNVLSEDVTERHFVAPLGAITSTLDSTLRHTDAAKNKLIVLHLMGSHAKYSSRVPQGFVAPFKTDQAELGALAEDHEFVDELLNPYDASVLYTDKLLSQLYDLVTAKLGTPSAFIYFPDHGEDVFGRKFHDAAAFTFPMVRIPLVMSFSPDWIAENAARFATLQNRRNDIFTLDAMYETVLGLTGIENFRFDKSRDLGSPDYAINESNAITMTPLPNIDRGFYVASPTHKITEDPQYIAQRNIQMLNNRYGDEVISEGNNTIARLAETAALGYNGFEFSTTLPLMHIGHYPEYVFDETIEQYLSHSNVGSFHRIWFDNKLIKGADIRAALPEMERLDAKFDLKKRVIFESWEPGLEVFSDKGWYTSYYIIPDQLVGCRDLARNGEMCADEIIKKINETRARSISFHARYYDFVAQFLSPRLVKDIGYNIFGFHEVDPDLNVDNPRLSDALDRHPLFKDPRTRSLLFMDTESVFPIH